MPREPPAVLFHGSATRFLDSIKQEGLKPGQRHHVHLSTDAITANTVGHGYGKPVVLEIDSKRMHQQGYDFFLSENNIWLVKTVPPEFISIKNKKEDF